MSAQRLAAFLGALVLACTAAMANSNGGGGSAIYPVMSRWTESYHAKTGVKVNYQPIGSGGGIRQTLANTIDFGNSDVPLSATDLKRGKLVQFPILYIAIVPVVNLPGFAPGSLVLDGPVLAKIFLGEIKRWDDPAIARLNPGRKMPGLPIIVVHRSDASGTSWHFTAYLAAVSPVWKASVGSGSAVAWPVGSAAQGNAGVVATLQQTRGGIGYVEYAYALQKKLSYTGLVNRAGTRVQPGMASFQAAAAMADFSRPGTNPIGENPPGKGSWPLTAATFMLMHKDFPKARNQEILRFLSYAIKDGKGLAEQLNYVPLPPSVAAKAEAAWAAELGVRP